MCGVVGAFGIQNSAEIILKMMDGLPNRGDGGAGITLAKDESDFYSQKTIHNVPELIREMISHNLSGYFSGIGHLRYGTTGKKKIMDNTQPLGANTSQGGIFVAHNGDSQFFKEDKKNLVEQGRIFWTSSDSELIVQHIYEGLARGKDSFTSVKEGLRKYRGTYSVVILIKDSEGIKLFAGRDRYGNRPLKLGRYEKGYVLASEDVAFEKVAAEFERDIKQGELLEISESGLRSEIIYDESELKLFLQCVYEQVYFGDPTSKIFGIPVASFRKRLGYMLAKRHGHQLKSNDIITYIPDSARFYGKGFCKSIHRDLKEIIIRSHAIRSFIQENDVVREDTIRRKFSFMRHEIKLILRNNPRARFVFIDDSIVRGTVARKIIRAFRRIANQELMKLGHSHSPVVIWMSAAPSLLGPCFKGIDMPGEDAQLIAPKFLASPLMPDTEKVAAEIEADFVYYSCLQDLRDTIKFFGQDINSFCYGCFENRDPIWSQW